MGRHKMTEREFGDLALRDKIIFSQANELIVVGIDEIQGFKTVSVKWKITSSVHQLRFNSELKLIEEHIANDWKTYRELSFCDVVIEKTTEEAMVT